MDSLAIIQGQKIVKSTVAFSRNRKVETIDRFAITQGQSMDRLAIIQSKIIVETTVGFSRKGKD